MDVKVIDCYVYFENYHYLILISKGILYHYVVINWIPYKLRPIDVRRNMTTENKSKLFIVTLYISWIKMIKSGIKYLCLVYSGFYHIWLDRPVKYQPITQIIRHDTNNINTKSTINKNSYNTIYPHFHYSYTVHTTEWH